MHALCGVRRQWPIVTLRDPPSQDRRGRGGGAYLLDLLVYIVEGEFGALAGLPAMVANNASQRQASSSRLHTVRGKKDSTKSWRPPLAANQWHLDLASKLDGCKLPPVDERCRADAAMDWELWIRQNEKKLKIKKKPVKEVPPSLRGKFLLRHGRDRAKGCEGLARWSDPRRSL